MDPFSLTVRNGFLLFPSVESNVIPEKPRTELHHEYIRLYQKEWDKCGTHNAEPINSIRHFEAGTDDFPHIANFYFKTYLN